MFELLYKVSHKPRSMEDRVGGKTRDEEADGPSLLLISGKMTEMVRKMLVSQSLLQKCNLYFKVIIMFIIYGWVRRQTIKDRVRHADGHILISSF